MLFLPLSRRFYLRHLISFNHWKEFLFLQFPKKASLEKGILSLANLGKETVRGLMVHAMVEVIRVNCPQAFLSG